ncbi:MAG: HAD family hydrolase [Firmicutes bacterium]|nr:HAD family hydrolase [Bacillota bacterium]
MSHTLNIIFDFDDTLVYTNELFDIAKDRFYLRMAELGFDDTDVPKLLNDCDIANIAKAGAMKSSCFANAMADAYAELCRRHGQAPDAAVTAEVVELGYQPYNARQRRFPGAEELLQRLRDRGDCRLNLVTQGEFAIQNRRIGESGFDKYFDNIFIVPLKYPTIYVDMCREQGWDAARTLSVGNSIRSDINPSITAGFKAVLLLIRAWDYEKTEPLGPHLRIAALEELDSIVEEMLK